MLKHLWERAPGVPTPGCEHVFETPCPEPCPETWVGAGGSRHGWKPLVETWLETPVGNLGK